MKLPARLRMRAVMFGSLKNGGHMQVREDVHGLGIQHVSTCPGRGQDWQVTITWESKFPGRVFATYADFKKAAEELPERYRARLVTHHCDRHGIKRTTKATCDQHGCAREGKQT